MVRFVVAAAAVGIFSLPASAAEYYVAKDPTTQVCKITKEKPDGTNLVMVGTDAYASKEKAKAARKAAGEIGECATTEKQAIESTD